MACAATNRQVMVTLRQVDGENVWDILNERGEVIRSHLELSAAEAEYERMTGSVARRTLARVSSHSAWLDGFRAGYLAAAQDGDRWVEDRVKRFVAPDMLRAEELSIEPYDFSYWVLGLLNGQPIHYPGLHGSLVAGQLSFHDEGGSGKEKRVLIVARPGSPAVDDVKRLSQAIDEAGAEMGAIISAAPASGEVINAAGAAGAYTSPLCGEAYPRIQLLTVADLLSGRGLDYPGVRRNLTGEASTSAAAAEPEALPATR